MAMEKVQVLIRQNPLIVFSKSTCPFCRSVKELFKSLGVEPKVVEINQEKDGAAYQKALFQISKQMTVPNVFIGGEHLGGNDATRKAYEKGDLVAMLKKAGVLKDEEENQKEPHDEVIKIEAETAKENVTKDVGEVHDLLEEGEDDKKNAIPAKDIVV